MNLEDLTIKQAREIALAIKETESAQESHPWKTGSNYFIRTVTHHYTGRLISVHRQELVLIDAAWIADDGRFAQAVKTAEFAEVEPYPDGFHVIIGRGSILDAVEVPSIPRVQK